MVIDVLSSTKGDVVKWIRSRLSRYGIKLRRSLSQVMLVEPKAYRRIFEVTQSCISSIEKPVIIEIGAGLGTLTSVLGRIDRGYIIAVEIDKRFSLILKEIQELYPNVDVVIGDARAILRSTRSVHTVVGNLPYHITADLLIAIGKSEALSAVITIQKDVADRLMAKPGTKNYGKITLFTQYLFDVELAAVLPPSFFIPSPEVFSAVVILKRRRSYSNYSIVEEIVKCLFSHRRKHVLKSLKTCLGTRVSSYSLECCDELWMKRVYQLAPEDVDKLVTMLGTLNFEKKM